MPPLKYLFFLFLFISSYFQAKAQLEVSFNFALGLANMNIESKSDTAAVTDYDSKAGLCIGPKVAYHIGHGLFVESGLLFKSRGYQVEENDIFIPGNIKKADAVHKFNINYLDIPLNIKISTMSPNGGNVFFMVGGYYGIALGGIHISTITYDVKSNDPTDKKDVESFSISMGDGKDDNIRKFDYGLSFGAGISLGKIDLSIHYDIGQSNVVPKSYWNEGSAQNRLFRINLGLKLYSGFGKKK